MEQMKTSGNQAGADKVCRDARHHTILPLCPFRNPLPLEEENHTDLSNINCCAKGVRGAEDLAPSLGLCVSTTNEK